MNAIATNLISSAVEQSASPELAMHKDIIRAAAPAAFLEMSKPNFEMLKRATPIMPKWLKELSPQQRADVRRLVEASVTAHTALNSVMANLKMPHEFAEPLVKAAVTEVFGIEVDVNHTFFRLHDLRMNLVDAAMHNFPLEGAPEDAVYEGNGSYSFENGVRLDHYPFISMCRKLDLGKQYQASIRQALEWDDADAQQVWRDAFVAYQKCALTAASRIALLSGDIEPKHHRALMALIDGQKPVYVDGKRLWSRSLAYMNLPLHGCIVFEITEPHDALFFEELAGVFHSSPGNEVIVYRPDDPEHPVKHYPNLAAFKTDLIRQLMPGSPDEKASANPTAYQTYFSRFFRHRHRARFFADCTEEVSPYERRQKRHLDFLLQLRVLRPQDGPWAQLDVWGELFTEFKNGFLLDARTQVISTEEVDGEEHRRVFAQLLQLGVIAAGLMSFAIPPLGVVMLGVSAVQLTCEVLEGVEELGVGDTEAGWAHINDVLRNVAWGAATVSFMGSLNLAFTPVELASGQRRLWKPDLGSYQTPVSLEGLQANELNQYWVAGKRYVRADGLVIEQGYDAAIGKWRASHPTRANAYQPILDQDSVGQWYVALDQNPPRLAPDAAMHRMVGKGIGNSAYQRYAVPESEIAGLSASNGIYRSVDGQRFYIRNLDVTGRVSVYRIRDAFNVGGDVLDVNIVDPATNRASEVRLWQMEADQWHKLSLSGGNLDVSDNHLITPNDLVDWHQSATQSPGVFTLRKFAIDRGLSPATLERYVLADGSFTAEGLAFIEDSHLPKQPIGERDLTRWMELSAHERRALTREGFANRYRLDAEAFMARANDDGTINPIPFPVTRISREQLSNGLWKPEIDTTIKQQLEPVTFVWGKRVYELPATDESVDIRSELSFPAFDRTIINCDLIEPNKFKYSTAVTQQLLNRQGGGRFFFVMRRVKYSGALQGEFNAMHVLDLEAGQSFERANAVSGYWAPQGGYVDVPVHPGWSDPDYVFTPSFSGCSLVVDQLDESLLRVRHVEGGHENAQYNHLPAKEHGWGMSESMDYTDYGLQPDQHDQVDSRLCGFAFMQYDRTDGVWSLHYQSISGPPVISRYSITQPGLFRSTASRVAAYSQEKVRGTTSRRLIVADKPPV